MIMLIPMMVGVGIVVIIMTIFILMDTSIRIGSLFACLFWSKISQFATFSCRTSSWLLSFAVDSKTVKTAYSVNFHRYRDVLYIDHSNKGLYIQGDSVHKLRLVVEWALALSQSDLVCRCYTFSLQLTTLTGRGTTQAIPYQWPKLTLSIRIDLKVLKHRVSQNGCFINPSFSKWTMDPAWHYCTSTKKNNIYIYTHILYTQYIYILNIILHIQLVHRNHYIISSSSSKTCQKRHQLVLQFFGSLSLKGISTSDILTPKKNQRYIQKPAR